MIQFLQAPRNSSLPCRQILIHKIIYSARLSPEFILFHFLAIEMDATACNLPLCGIHHFYSNSMEVQAGKSMFAVKVPQSLKSSSFRRRWGGSSKLKLKSRSSIRVLASSSNSVYESSASAKIEKDNDGGLVCPPGYQPTPANRELRTPHSG